jgi:hypothetical protein
MAWKFGPIELPVPPTTMTRRVLRKQEAKQILFDFPIPTDTGPDLFELQITGMIWPSNKAFALWELTKNADEPSIQITVDENDPNFGMYNGRYAVNKSQSTVSAAEEVKDAGFIGGSGPLHRYDITFVQFADQGSTQDTDVIDPDGDEDGPGFDFPDDTGDSFDFEEFINILQRIFSI